MKTKLIYVFAVCLFLASCEKEEDILPYVPEVEPSPLILKYDVDSQYAVFQNNRDSTTKLIGFVDTYGIKFTYQYLENDTVRTRFAMVFPQFDKGSLCLQNKNDTVRTKERADALKYKVEFDNYSFYWKWGIAKETFTIAPIPVGDTTSLITITNNITQRKLYLPLQPFLKQTICLMYYDY